MTDMRSPGRTFVTSLAASAGLLVLTGVNGHYGVLATVRFLGGFSTAVTFVLGSALAARIHAGTHHHRSTYLVAIYMAGVGAGVALSGLVVPGVTRALDQAAAWRTGWILLGAVALALLVPATWAARQVRPQPTGATVDQDPIGLIRLAPTFVWYLLYGAGYVSYMTFVVALLHTRGVSDLGHFRPCCLGHFRARCVGYFRVLGDGDFRLGGDLREAGGGVGGDGLERLMASR